MANIKSQIKRNRQTIKRTERNKAVRSELKTRTKSAATAAAEGAENAAELVRAAAEAGRLRRLQGRDPQERGRPSQLAPGQEAQPEHLRRLTERYPPQLWGVSEISGSPRHRGQTGHEHL